MPARRSPLRPAPPSWSSSRRQRPTRPSAKEIALRPNKADRADSWRADAKMDDVSHERQWAWVSSENFDYFDLRNQPLEAARIDRLHGVTPERWLAAHRRMQTMNGRESKAAPHRARSSS